jgi:Zn-dependent peptidase ImmA (M78 family)
MNRVKIKAFIDTLLERHQLVKFPVDLEEWIKVAGAELRLQDFGGEMSGFAYQKKGIKIIGIQFDEPETRQRFTTAHELAHMFLHKDKAVNYDKSSMMLRTSDHVGRGTDQREIEANDFAAELLMPEECIREDVNKLDGVDLQDDAKIAELANKYNVSVPAMTIRLSTLYFQ